MEIIRYAVTKRNYTLWERFRIGFYSAMRTPKDYNIRVVVNPGDPGYDDAPYEQVVTAGRGSDIYCRLKL